MRVLASCGLCGLESQQSFRQELMVVQLGGAKRMFSKPSWCMSRFVSEMMVCRHDTEASRGWRFRPSEWREEQSTLRCHFPVRSQSLFQDVSGFGGRMSQPCLSLFRLNAFRLGQPDPTSWISGWWFGTCFFSIYWESSSQMTCISFRGVAQPPTSVLLIC